MQVSLLRQPIENIESEVVILPVLQDRREERWGLGELCDAGEISGKPFEMTLLHHVPGHAREAAAGRRRGEAREVQPGGVAPRGGRRGAALEIKID